MANCLARSFRNYLYADQELTVFALVYGDNEVSLPLNLTAEIEDRLLGLLFEYEAGPKIRIELGKRIVDGVTEAVDRVQQPSDKQVRYATAVAKSLNLELSPSVLQSREAMRRFLDKYAEPYRLECARRRSKISPATNLP